MRRFSSLLLVLLSKSTLARSSNSPTPIGSLHPTNPLAHSISYQACSPSIPRGGGILSHNWRRITRYTHDTMKALLPSHWADLYQEQTAAAQTRRDYYHLNANLATTFFATLFHPLRVTKLAAAAYIFVQVLEFLTGQETLSTFWSFSVKPILLGRFSSLQAWWKKGRKKGGLFLGETWERRSDRPQVLLEAWNRQLSHKYQRVLGTALGLVLSPTVWACTGPVGTYLACAVGVMQINYFCGEQLELLLRPLSKPLSEAWGEVDVILERLRRQVGKTIAKPLAMLKAVDEELVPDAMVPAGMQQGFVMGMVLGFLVGA